MGQNIRKLSKDKTLFFNLNLMLNHLRLWMSN